jgi:large subunit ribosomal protein L17
LNTTLAKAKAVAPEIDKTLKLVRKNTLASKKQLLAKLGNDREVFDVLFGKYLGIATKKQSGFTRIIKMAPRRGDRAAMARLEMVEKPVEEKKEKKEVKEVKKVKKETKEVKKSEEKA